MRRRLVAAPAYIKKHAKPKTPADLSEWDWLELSPVWQIKPVFKKAGKKIVIEKRKTSLSVDNAQALCQLACAGAGLALLPEFLIYPDVQAGNLDYVLEDWSVDPINVYAVWPSNAPKDGLINLYLKFFNQFSKQ